MQGSQGSGRQWSQVFGTQRLQKIMTITRTWITKTRPEDLEDKGDKEDLDGHDADSDLGHKDDDADLEDLDSDKDLEDKDNDNAMGGTFFSMVFFFIFCSVISFTM